MSDFTSSNAVYAEWIEPDPGEILEDWIVNEYVVRAAKLPGVVHAEHLVSSSGGSVCLVWFDGAEARAGLEVLGKELHARGDARIADGGGFFTARSAFGESRPAPVVLAVKLRVNPGAEQDAREWLDGEHAPRQLSTPGSVSFRGFEPDSATGPFLNLWGLESDQITSSTEWVSKRDTPWRDRFWQSVQGTVGSQYKRTVR